jgi:hypothetical protein
MRSLLAILTSLLLTGLAPAQSLVVDAKDAHAASLSTATPSIFDQLFYYPASIGTPAGTQNVMPLWSTPDGRILAIVALGSDNESLPTLSPAPRFSSAPELQFIDVTDFVSGGLGIKLRDSVNAYARFDRGVVLTPTNSTSLECNSALNLAFDSHCLVALPRGNDGSVHVGTALTAGDMDVDLSYGLSWIHADDQNRAPTIPQQAFWDFFGVASTTGIPTLVIPGLEPSNIRNASATATGRWHFDENQSLDLSAAIGRLQLEVPGNSVALPNLNQAALSFGVHRGDFSGVVIGHVLGPADLLNSNQRWSSLDLGISWRAPWRGVFSVGAQNLWSSGNAPAMVDPTAHEVDPSQARVPYVQYHQDL